MKKVCLITGVGDGTGAALVRRFAAAGYAIAMLARTAERLSALEGEIPETKGYVCDVADLERLGAVIEEVRDDVGDPTVLIHNAVSARGFLKTFDAVTTEDIEANMRVNVTALLALAQALAPAMTTRGEGAILVTGNTGSWRGVANYAAFAPSKAAQRILAEALARDLGPKGVHVAYVVVDALIDMPPIRRFFADLPEEAFARPQDLAEEFFHIAHQPRSTWSFDVELRPFCEKW